MDEKARLTPVEQGLNEVTTSPLAFSEIRYCRPFETARDGILILDARTGEIIDANPFMVELLGYTHDELVGKALWQIGLFEDEEASRVAVRELQAQGHVHFENLPIQTRQGARRYVEFVSSVCNDGRGTVIMCNVSDIPGLRQVHTELRAAYDRLQIAYERERSITDALQRSLTLEVTPDSFSGLSVATLYEPALSEAEVGGDFFDAFALPRDRIAIAIADASGKGLSAAVRAIRIKDVLRAFTREYPHSLPTIFARLNNFVCDRQLFGEQGNDTFICLALAILDLKTGV
jgi:PAS domain S-box-containing protein